MTVLIAMLALSSVAIGLRCYTRLAILGQFFPEDWLTMITLVIYCGYTAIGILAVQHGMGSHLVDVSLVDRPKAMMYREIDTLLYVVISALTKLIVILLLLRIVPATARWQRLSLRVIMSVVGLFSIFYFFIALFTCQPVSYFWEEYNELNPSKSGKCNSQAAATVTTYVATVINIGVDWWLAILPSILLWRAKMDLRTKISTCGVLAIGALASIATVARIPYARDILGNPDYLYNFTNIAIWSTIEIGMALTASSLATLKPLFRKLNIFDSEHRKSAFIGAYSQDFHCQGLDNASGNRNSNHPAMAIREDEGSAPGTNGIKVESNVSSSGSQEHYLVVEPDREGISWMKWHSRGRDTERNAPV